jgi:hypothetical protein
MNFAAVQRALDYLADNNIQLPSELTLQLEVKGFRNFVATRATKQADDISEINATYHDAITETLTSYFEDGGSVSAPRNEFKKEMSDAFVNAFESGWVDGGQELPLDDDALEWLGARQSQEFGFIDQLFQEAKELRKEEDFDYFSWITTRADGYVATVLSVYNAAVLLAKKNQMLTWNLGGTETHCETCKSLGGQRHRASWYLNRDYIPRKPGAAMLCGGYYCDCTLSDDDGNDITI